jgi:hypothetical protein
MLGHERAEGADRSGINDRIRVRGDDELGRRPCKTHVQVRGEPKRLGVDNRVDTRRNRSRDVRDHDQLVDLRLQRRQRLGDILRRAVRDDDGGHLHRSTLR